MFFTSHVRPFATIVSTVDEMGQIKVGYSICCEGDRFKKKTGRALAMNNLKPLSKAIAENANVISFNEKYKKNEVVKRASVILEISIHVDRLKRYYKGKEIW